MDVSVNILGAVELYDPVHQREVNTSGGNVSRKENCVLLLYKLEVNGCTLVLLLLAMQLKQVLAKFQSLEGLVGKSNLLPRREKHQTLGLGVTLEETEQEVKLIFNFGFHIIVQQFYWRDRLDFVGDFFVLGCLVTFKFI